VHVLSSSELQRGVGCNLRFILPFEICYEQLEKHNKARDLQAMI
jgi:hypothetical protein